MKKKKPKNGINEPFSKQKQHHRCRKHFYSYQEGDWQGGEGGINWEIVTNIYILPNSTTTKYILPNKIDNKNQAYSTGNSVQYFVMTYMEQNLKKSDICLRITDSLCCTLETDTTL